MDNGWSWGTQSRGTHAGAYDINECGECPECVFPGTGRHRTPTTSGELDGPWN